MQALQEKKRYTYADYANRGDDIRYELIDGVIYMMTPPPTRIHQAISGELYYQLRHFLSGKPCEVYAAPFCVRLNPDSDDDTVLEPDLLVVCDKSKLGDAGVNGAPDMIVEILSPSTARRDRVLKFNKYLHAGVREYWIVDPGDKTVSVHILKGGSYVTSAYTDADTIPVHVLDGCTINMKDIFEVIK